MVTIVTIPSPHTVTLRPRPPLEGGQVAELGRARHGRLPLERVEDHLFGRVGPMGLSRPIWDTE